MKGRPRSKATSVPFISKGHPPPKIVSMEEEMRIGYEEDLTVCGEDGAWERALELLGMMRKDDCQRTYRAWIPAVAACAKVGRWAEASELLKEMEQHRSPPDHTSYNLAIEACEEEGNYAHAGQLMLEMRQRGLMPQLDTYTKFLRILVQNGEVEEARAMYAQAQAQGIFSVWVNRGRFLDLQELPIEVAEVVLRFAVEERAESMARHGKAGKGGFYVLTGQAKRATAHKQQAMIRVLREEFGLKVRVDPARFGRVELRGAELQRVGEELLRARAYSGKVHAR